MLSVDVAGGGVLLAACSLDAAWIVLRFKQMIVFSQSRTWAMRPVVLAPAAHVAASLTRPEYDAAVARHVPYLTFLAWCMTIYLLSIALPSLIADAVSRLCLSQRRSSTTARQRYVVLQLSRLVLCLVYGATQGLARPYSEWLFHCILLVTGMSLFLPMLCNVDPTTCPRHPFPWATPFLPGPGNKIWLIHRPDPQDADSNVLREIRPQLDAEARKLEHSHVRDVVSTWSPEFPFVTVNDQLDLLHRLRRGDLRYNPVLRSLTHADPYPVCWDNDLQQMVVRPMTRRQQQLWDRLQQQRQQREQHRQQQQEQQQEQEEQGGVGDLETGLMWDVAATAAGSDSEEEADAAWREHLRQMGVGVDLTDSEDESGDEASDAGLPVPTLADLAVRAVLASQQKWRGDQSIPDDVRYQLSHRAVMSFVAIPCLDTLAFVGVTLMLVAMPSLIGLASGSLPNVPDHVTDPTQQPLQYLRSTFATAFLAWLVITSLASVFYVFPSPRLRIATRNWPNTFAHALPLLLAYQLRQPRLARAVLRLRKLTSASEILLVIGANALLLTWASIVITVVLNSLPGSAITVAWSVAYVASITVKLFVLATSSCLQPDHCFVRTYGDDVL